MTPLFNLMTPYNVPMGQALIGAQWGSGERAAPSNNGTQLAAITVEQANSFRPMYLPGFGPQVPAGNVGWTTDEMPGNLFTTGFPSITQDGTRGYSFGSLGVSRASRATTDFMVPPVARQVPDGTPWQVKVSEWWNDLKASVRNPFTDGPAATVDQIPKPAQAGAGLNVGMMAVAGAAVAAVAVAAVARR